MRITIVHSYYRSAESSGENAAVDAQVGALQRAGHEVQLVAQRTDTRSRSKSYPVVAAVTVAAGIGPTPMADIAAFQPDVVHVHNLFPNFGRRWVRNLEVPLVTTLHNFRPLCAAGTLFRDGSICTLCPDGDRWAGARFGCYRGSRVQTLPLSIGNRHGAAGDPVLDRAAAIVVLSDRARRIYEAAKVPAWKMLCIPNYIPDDGPAEPPGDDARAGWLFAGRLTEEKGIDLLVDRWPADSVLRVAGDGPLASRVASSAKGKPIEILGTRSTAELVELMRSSVGLVLPSRWYEGFPMVYGEALGAGLPVVAFHPSSVADLIQADDTGMVASWSDDLGEVIRRAAGLFPTLRETCRSVFDREYTEGVFVQRMEALYSRVLTCAPPEKQHSC